MSAAPFARRLTDLRTQPQRFRLWYKNLRFQHLLKRWEALEALATSGTFNPGFVALRGRQLEAEWEKVAAFYTRYEAIRARIAALRTKRGQNVISLESQVEMFDRDLPRLAGRWSRLESEPFYVGDESIFVTVETDLTTLEDRWQHLVASATASTVHAASPVTNDAESLRANAQRLLAEVNALVKQLGLTQALSASVMEDRRHIVELLDDGQSACAFWWAKDLHAWLQGMMERRTASNGSPPTREKGSNAKHRDFQKVCKAVQAMLHTPLDQLSKGVG